MKHIIVPLEHKSKRPIYENSENSKNPGVNTSNYNDTERITNNNEEKKERTDSLEDDNEKTNDTTDEYLKDVNLEERTSKKKFASGYSKSSHHKGRFTSTWVQYSDGLGYAYGGSDQLTYEPTTKNRFIRRVFALVFLLEMLTATYNFSASKLRPRALYQDIVCLYIVVPIAVFVVSLNYFMAYSDCTKIAPIRHIFMLLTVVGTSLVGGFFSGYYDTLLITYGYVTTAFVAMTFVIIANTSYDFTHWSLYLIAVCAAIPWISTFYVLAKIGIIEHVRPAYPLYALILMVVGTLMNILIMTASLQIILGSQAIEILEDDYVVGAFYLYTSIFDIFIKIVQLSGLFQRNDDEE